MGPACAGDDNYDCRCYFFAAARSTKVLPPFILCDNGASLIWMTTASASTPRFLTSAWVMSLIMPAFCSSVRPAAMLTVISGIFISLFVLAARFHQRKTSLQQCRVPRPRQRASSPLHFMTRQHLAYFGDDLILVAGKLRGARFAPLLMRGDRGGRLGAFDQILDLHLAARFFIRALDDDARRVAPVGIFQLVAHVFGIAEIKLRAEPRI